MAAATVASMEKGAAEEPTASSSNAASLSEDVRALRQMVAEQQASIRQLLEGQQRLEASLAEEQPKASGGSSGGNLSAAGCGSSAGRRSGRSSPKMLAKFKAGTRGSIGTLSSSRDYLEQRGKDLEGLHERLSEKFKSQTKSTIRSRGPRNRCQRITEHPAFEYLSAVLILLHSVAIGAYVEYLAVAEEHQHPFILTVNVVLAIVFVGEVLLKLGAERAAFFSGAERMWNLFDCVLVFMLIVEIVMHVMHVHNIAALVKIGEMFRTGRVLRILKCLRLSHTFQVILSKILFSLRSLFWVMLLVFMLLYVVAVCIAQGVVDFMHGEQHSVDFDPHHIGTVRLAIFEQFGSVEKSLYTLFQSITGGQLWGPAADSLREVHGFYAALFITFIAVTTLSVLNIVTGIFVDATIMSAKHQRDEMTDTERAQQELQAQHLREVFCEIDADGNGALPLEEFEEIVQDERVLMFLQSMKIETSDIRRLFKMLDQDNSGEIVLEEFVNGCMHLQGGARNFDVHRLLAGQRRLQRHLDDLTLTVMGSAQRQLSARRRSGRQATVEEEPQQGKSQAGDHPIHVVPEHSDDIVVHSDFPPKRSVWKLVEATSGATAAQVDAPSASDAEFNHKFEV